MDQLTTIGVYGTSLEAFDSTTETFRTDVLEGLSSSPKRLACKYFYDEHGSRLFEQICELDEYYLTRTELRIMQQYRFQMASHIGSRVMLVELGSGSSVKTHILLRHLQQPVAYVPIDISREHLFQTAHRLATLYREIEVLPVCADFTEAIELPDTKRRTSRRVVYFPGSTIGNFELRAARQILAKIASLAGDGGGLLIGIDLQKDKKTIEAAYNDRRGITARFNLNLLTRINRELDADFDTDAFRHQAFYDEEHGRMDIRLASLREQSVRIGDETIDFAEGEPIHTEYSHKYTIEGFSELAGQAGWTIERYWTDQREYFGVLYLTRS